MDISRIERYSRQSEVVLLDRLAQSTVRVVGTGAIGRNLSLQLGTIGVPNLELVDFDTVEVGNLAAQGFREADIGQKKVIAVRDVILQLNSQINVKAIDSRFKKSFKQADYVFCCVDSIDTRKRIWETVKGKCRLFIDGRMMAEVMRILSVYDEESANYYETTLFNIEETQAGRCTAKTTLYCSNIASALMVSNLTKYLRGVNPDKEIFLNLYTSELEIIAGKP